MYDVIENVLEEHHFTFLYSVIFGGEQEWKVTPDIAGTGRANTMGFHDTFYFMNGGIQNEKTLFLCFPILGICCSREGFGDFDMLAGRVFQTVPVNPVPDFRSTVHTDFPTGDGNEFIPYRVCLYFLTSHEEEQAATVFFDDDLNVVDKFQPKANTALLFDGSIKHCGGFPASGRRIIVNFNYSSKGLADRFFRGES